MSKDMLFVRVDPAMLKALDNAAESMKETTRARLVRIILMDWLEKFAPKNNSK